MEKEYIREGVFHSRATFFDSGEANLGGLEVRCECRNGKG